MLIAGRNELLHANRMIALRLKPCHLRLELIAGRGHRIAIPLGGDVVITQRNQALALRTHPAW